MRIPASIAATVFICLLFAPRLDGGETTVRGKVTYVAAGTVYTSLGREHGLRDSTLLVVVSKKDTIATVMVLALSTQSSSCVVVRSSRTVNIGDEVFGTVAATNPGTSSGNPTTGVSSISPASGCGTADVCIPQKPLYRRATSLNCTEGSARSTSPQCSKVDLQHTQPGLVVSLRGAMRDVPLRFDMYANFRTVAFGTRSPFAKNSVNQSRIYGLSLSYDDGGTVASLGRIIPTFSPSIGYVDGALHLAENWQHRHRHRRGIPAGLDHARSFDRLQQDRALRGVQLTRPSRSLLFRSICSYLLSCDPRPGGRRASL